MAATIPELSGSFYAGIDLAKKEDFSVVAVLRKDEDAFRLVHLNVFPQGTEYVGVINYLKALSERLKTVHKFLVDQTGVGEAVLEQAQKTVPNIEGVILTAPSKQEILGYLKLMMQERRILFPYELDFLQELNIERYELTKVGQIQFSHPSGTHDDRFWAFALAVFATKATPFPQLKRSHTQWLETTRAAGTSAATRMIRAAMSATERTTRRIQAAIDKGEPLMVALEDWPHMRHCLHTLAAFYIDTGQAVKAQIALSEVQRLDSKLGFPWRKRKPVE